MNRDSNIYTFIFATILVVVVASALAITATSLKDEQQTNVNNEKMQNILSTIGIEIDRDASRELFNKYVTAQITLTADSEIDEQTRAFDLDLTKELKKSLQEQKFPIYVANYSDETYYIIPLRGAGLWNAIWGYISLKSDCNTIAGVVFDHAGETAGLGAEITQKWFQERFVGEKIFDENNQLTGITVLKGNNDPNGTDKEDHEVDAISGATITGNGVTAMIAERLSHYVKYIEQIKHKK